MTSIVAIRCKDGVVIGSDSSATFGDGVYSRTIEQLTDKKIEIVGSSRKIIIAGTGQVGLHQRFVEAVKQANAKKELNASSEIELAKRLSTIGVSDFGQTIPAPHMGNIGYSAFVALECNKQPCLVELTGPQGFQPEVKKLNDLWFTSSGSGQAITDPFLALFRTVFWSANAPDVKGGVFTAYWALIHACEINPGGIKEPVRIAVLGTRNSSLDAWMLSDDELQETKDLVAAATDHFGSFRNLLLGQSSSAAIPPNL